MRDLYAEKSEPAFRFSHDTDNSLSRTAKGIGRSVYALVNTPDHDHKLFKEVSEGLVEPQPVQAPIEEEMAAILKGPATLIDRDLQPKLSSKELLGIMGVCIQFSCHVPELRPFAETPFDHVDNLYQQITSEGHEQPLGFSDQLTTALEQTKGDLPEAVWRLFITSRQHARWMDSSVIADEPNFTRDEKKERMTRFSNSVAACKPHETHPDQDTGGDTYYSWTHALGRVAFGALAKNSRSLGVKAGGRAMYSGTQLMQEIAFKLKPQTMKSDHKLAGEYGNAIGDTLVSVLQDKAA